MCIINQNGDVKCSNKQTDNKKESNKTDSGLGLNRVIMVHNVFEYLFCILNQLKTCFCFGLC